MTRLLILCLLLNGWYLWVTAQTLQLSTHKHNTQYWEGEGINLEFMVKNTSSTTQKVIAPTLGVNVWAKLTSLETKNVVEFKDIITPTYNTQSIRKMVMSNVDKYGLVLVPYKSVSVWLEVHRLLGEIHEGLKNIPQSARNPYAYKLKPGRYELEIQYFVTNTVNPLILKESFEVKPPPATLLVPYQQYVNTLKNTLSLPETEKNYAALTRYLDTYPDSPYADNIFSLLIDRGNVQELMISNQNYMRYYYERIQYGRDLALCNRLVNFQIFYAATSMAKKESGFSEDAFYTRCALLMKQYYELEYLKNFVQSGKQRGIKLFAELAEKMQ